MDADAGELQARAREIVQRAARQLAAVYGELGSQIAGWLRRYEPRTVEALHLLEGLVRSPKALATLLQAAGAGAIEQVGRILAGWLEAGGGQ